MFFSQNRNEIRNFFRDSWKKLVNKQPIEPLEILVGEVVAMHPEYHAMLEAEHADLDHDYLAEDGQTNPFLHMGMHITLREQCSSNHPEGITEIYKKTLIKSGEQHAAEHIMMDCLAETLWQAQKNGCMPDDQAYLNCLKQLIK